jgi:hypothetical protein
MTQSGHGCPCANSVQCAGLLIPFLKALCCRAELAELVNGRTCRRESEWLKRLRDKLVEVRPGSDAGADVRVEVPAGSFRNKSRNTSRAGSSGLVPLGRARDCRHRDGPYRSGRRLCSPSPICPSHPYHRLPPGSSAVAAVRELDRPPGIAAHPGRNPLLASSLSNRAMRGMSGRGEQLFCSFGNELNDWRVLSTKSPHLN